MGLAYLIDNHVDGGKGKGNPSLGSNRTPEPPTTTEIDGPAPSLSQVGNVIEIARWAGREEEWGRGGGGRVEQKQFRHGVQNLNPLERN